MRYYLHRRTATGIIMDPEGSELHDIDAARDEAVLAARQLWAAAILAGYDLPDESFEIVDDDGQLLMSVPFQDALPPSLRR